MPLSTLVPFGAQKSLIHGPNRTRNEKNPPEKIMQGAVKFIGALIVTYNNCPEKIILIISSG